jgi:acetyltransferase-like isoleucine patch superfamily enzyme
MRKLRAIRMFLLNNIFHFILKFYKNVTTSKSVFFYKFPILNLHKNARIIFGENVSINSDNYSYHVNMFQKCKLMADTDGAIISIGDNTRIHGSCIHAQKSISIGKNCLIAANCQIIDSNGHLINLISPETRLNLRDKPKSIIIEDNVWIGTGVVVLPGIKIGEGSVIGANSVVSIDIPKNSIAKGNPILIIKNIRENNSTY